MKYIDYNNKKLSTIVMGCMRISDLSVEDVERLVDTCLEVGINSFDLADIYGGGKSEIVLGKVLKKRPELREKMWIQSKCGIRNQGPVPFFDFSKEYILKSVDGILERLQTDHVDSLLLHRPDVLMEPEEVNEAFEILKSEGKVLSFGVSNMNPAQIELLKKEVKQPLMINQLQLSAAFSPAFNFGFNVNMENEASINHDGSIFEYCRLKDMVIQSWSSLQYGYFEGVFLDNEKFPKLNSVLKRLAKEKGVTPTAIALAWILRYPAKMQAVIGTTKPERIIESAKATEITLTREEWYEIYLSAGHQLP